MGIDTIRALPTCKRSMDTATMRKRGSMETTSRAVCVPSIRTLRSGVRGNYHAPFWNSGRWSDPPLDCNHQVHGALALGAHNRVVVNAQTRTDPFKGLGDEGAAAVRNEVLWHPVASTRGIEHGQRHPTGFRAGHSACQHRPRIAVEDDQAPPPVARQGKIHHASVDKPVL